MRFRLKTHTPFSPSIHTNTIENGGVCLRKRRFSKTLSRVEVFENGGSASLCGRAKPEVFENGGSASLCGRGKTEVSENDYVNGIGMPQLKKQNGCFLMRFRWSSVDGRKRCKNASVDEKLFIRFQETENGGFRKRISVRNHTPRVIDINKLSS